MTGTQTRRRPPARRKKGGRGAGKRPSFGWKLRLLAAGFASAVGLLVLGAAARHWAPMSDTSLARFDAIILIGYPATSDGNPSPRELASVAEAVREYERGAAPRLIFTGAAVKNRFVEAQVMARAAEAQGIPPEAVLTETHSRNTIQNACYAVRAMQEHGWKSAEVIADSVSLPRAAAIFRTFPVEWRMHAAPAFEPQSTAGRLAGDLWEDAETARYLLWSRFTKSCPE